LSLIERLISDCHDLLENVADVLSPMLLVCRSANQHSTASPTGVLHAVVTANHMLGRGASHTERLQAV